MQTLQIVFKTKTMNEIKPTQLFSWLASYFLEHFYSCLSPFLTYYVRPPGILQTYLNLFFIIPHEILYTEFIYTFSNVSNFQTKNKLKELILAKISHIPQISHVI